MSTIAEKLTTIAENEQKVYDKGADDGKRKYWKCFTVNGTRTDYKYAFMNTDFSGETIPSDLFRPTETSNFAFQYYQGKSLPLGLDFSGVPIGQTLSDSTTYRLFYYAEFLEEVYDIKLPNQRAYQSMFENCTSLKKVEKLVVYSIATFGKTFKNCNSLVDIIFDGVIGRSINFQYSPLSIASMKNIISCLANYSTDNTGTNTVTFTDACWEALEASGKPYDDGLTEDATLTWKNYVISLGWNV